MRHGASGRSFLRLFGVLILVVGLLPMLAASATTGETKIVVDGVTVTLTEDHTGTITIMADDVTLDCAGHLVTWEKEKAEDPNEWFGIGILESTGVTVANCEVSGDFDFGILSSLGSNNTVKNNDVHGNGGGIVIHQSHGTVATGNDVYENNAGIAGGGVGLVVSYNEVWDNTGWAGIGLTTSDSEVIGNRVHDNNVNGIAIDTGSADVVLAENTSHGNTEHGIRISFSERVTAHSNTLTGNGGDGLRVWDSAVVTVERNAFDGNDGNGLVIFLAEALTATGNTFNGNGINGFAIYSSEAAFVEKNLAFDNTDFGFKIRRTVESSFLRNRAERNGASGFEVGEVDSSLFFKNKAIENYVGFNVFREDPRFLDSADNAFFKNKAFANVDYGFLDDLGGLNTYDHNVCNENGFEASEPAGLCR